MKIFDINCLGANSGSKRGKGRLDKTPKLTINKSLRQIAFNTCASEKLELLSKGIRFELEDDGTWFITPDSSDHGIKVTAYRGVYYFVSIMLTKSMLPMAEQNTATCKLVREGDRWRVIDISKYPELKHPQVTKTKSASSIGQQRPKLEKEIKKAKKIMNQFYRTEDFPGRIKTMTVIASERLLASYQ